MPARIPVHVHDPASADCGLAGEAWDIEGDVVVLVCLSEAVEDAGRGLEGWPGDFLVGICDDPAFAGGVLDAGDGGEFVTVGRGA